MSVPILDRQQTPGGVGGGGGLPAVAAGNDDVAAGQGSTQQVTDGTAAATELASCGQGLINTSTNYAPLSLSPSRKEAPSSPQPQLSMNANRDTRKPFDRRRQQQHQGQRPNGGGKNKQHDDSDAPDAYATKQALDRQINQGTPGDDGARPTSGANQQLRFKLPNPIQETTTSPSRTSEHPVQINISGLAPALTIRATDNKPLAITRHHSTIEMSSAPVANRMLKRKTSVFSHDGFMGLHKLDQSAIQQHAVVSAVATINVSRDDAAEALQQQVDKSKEQSASKTTMAASSPPRQPYRSDTLGSTGSSRASSCDEPTIVSPAKLLAPTPDIARELKSGKNLISIPSSRDPTAAPSSELSPLDSLAKRIIGEHDHPGQGGQRQDNYTDDAEPTMMQCDNEDDDNDDNNAHERDAKQRNSRKGQQQDSTSDEDEDELDDEGDEDDDDEDDDDEINKNNASGQRPQRVSLSTNFRESLKIPPFESIKTQIKKNSIPNAEDIKRHIEKLISRNEEIIDNWNQVSIRSYNSSSSSSGAVATGGSTAAPTVAAAAAAVTVTNRRPSKRWSTTVLCTKGTGITLNPSSSGASLADQNQGTTPGKPMSGSERKRSQINHPVRRVSYQHKPLTIFNEPQPHQTATTYSQQQQHLLIQTTTGSTYPGPTQVSHSMPSSPKQLVKPLSNEHHQRVPPNYQHQTIESAIENLSLKKRHGEEGLFSNQIDHLGTNNSGSDLVMAAVLVERQRQQQILDEYLRQRATSGHHEHHQQQMNFSHQAQVAPPNPTLPNLILDHYQQQLISHQQQQLLEHQLGLSRLAALENELMQQRQQQQQAVADLMNAASVQNQQSLAAAAALADATSLNLPQAVTQFNSQAATLENQLLNEHLAKMMILTRQQDHQALELASTKPASRLSPSGDQLAGGRPVGPFQVSPTSPSRVYLGHGSELQTQSLDSATPSYRCEACDISFWTRDLLNYHSMTSCSAHTGPRPNKPIAFSFNQANGFDSTRASTSELASQSVARHSSLQSPSVVVSCADTGATSSATATSYQHHHHHHHHKPVGPSRRRTYDELNAPSSPYMATYRDLLIRNHQQQQQQQQNSHQRQLSTSSIESRQVRDQQQQRGQLSPPGPSKSGLLKAPKSPHKTRESAELTWQQRLEELSILKHQLSLNGGAGLAGLADLALADQQQQSQRAQQVTLSGNDNQESKLPIKKRKISEPNMKY